MSSLILLSAALLVAISPTAYARNNTDSCLPAGIQPTDVVSTRTTVSRNKGKVSTVTVSEKLIELKARCRKHKLVDGNSREIRFFQLVGCWGNPPEDFQQQLERQAKELARLRKRYRVIEMTCNATGDPRTIS